MPCSSPQHIEMVTEAQEEEREREQGSRSKLKGLPDVKSVRPLRGRRKAGQLPHPHSHTPPAFRVQPRAGPLLLAGHAGVLCAVQSRRWRSLGSKGAVLSLVEGRGLRCSTVGSAWLYCRERTCPLFLLISRAPESLYVLEPS